MSAFNFLSYPRSNPKFVRAIRMFGFGLTFLSIVIVIWRASSGGVINDWKQGLRVLTISFSSFSFSFVLQALAWCVLIGALGRFKAGWKDLEIYAYSNLMKRTPGAIWYLLERVDYYGKQGLSRGSTLSASGIEWILWGVAGALVYLLFSASILGKTGQVGGVAASLLLVVLSYISLKRRAPYNTIEFSSQTNPSKLNRFTSFAPEMFIVLFIYGLCHIFGGVIIYQLVLGLISPNQFFISDAIRLWTLTSTLAFISSVIIPFNIGLHEVTLSAALLTIVPLDLAITVSAELRLILIISDLACSLGLWYLARRILAREEIAE